MLHPLCLSFQNPRDTYCAPVERNVPDPAFLAHLGSTSFCLWYFQSNPNPILNAVLWIPRNACLMNKWLSIREKTEQEKKSWLYRHPVMHRSHPILSHPTSHTYASSHSSCVSEPLSWCIQIALRFAIPLLNESQCENQSSPGLYQWALDVRGEVKVDTKYQRSTAVEVCRNLQTSQRS